MRKTMILIYIVLGIFIVLATVYLLFFNKQFCEARDCDWYVTNSTGLQEYCVCGLYETSEPEIETNRDHPDRLTSAMAGCQPEKFEALENWISEGREGYTEKIKELVLLKERCKK